MSYFQAVPVYVIKKFHFDEEGTKVIDEGEIAYISIVPVVQKDRTLPCEGRGGGSNPPRNSSIKFYHKG